MTWACENGHQVRQGMFACPECGSDDVRERDEAAVVEPPVADAVVGAADQRREAAMQSLFGALVGGVVLYLLGAAIGGGIVVAADGISSAVTAGLVLGALVQFAGAALVLVALVGYGVKLGTEAVDRGDAAPSPSGTATP